MARYVIVRVWLPDRPGSLGQLASRIGEFGGDLVGIDILERDGGRAVDELTLELPDGYSPEDLAAVLSQLPEVEVEDLRHLVSRVPDTGRDPLDAAVLLAESTSPPELSHALARGVCTAFACDWSTVLEVSGAGTTALAAVGHPPRAAWLCAFVAGAQAGLSLSGGGFGLTAHGTSRGPRSARRAWWSWPGAMARRFGAANAANSSSCAGSLTPGGTR
jgi:hypothetical protein